MSENGSSLSGDDAARHAVDAVPLYTPETQAARREYVAQKTFDAFVTLTAADPAHLADMVDRVMRAHQLLGQAVTEIMKADLA